MAWTATGQPTARKQRDKLVVRVVSRLRVGRQRGRVWFLAGTSAWPAVRDMDGTLVRCAWDRCPCTMTSTAVPDQSLEEASMNKVITTRSNGRVTGMALAVLAATALAGCGDDAKADPTTTTIAETVEQFGARIDAQCPGGDPGFDPFLAEHPEPTAADWAEFLPAPLKMVSDLRDCIAASHPPAAIADDIEAVVAAFDVVIVDVDKALAAAKAGDLATADEWLAQMHDVDQPKIDEAISQVGVD